MSAQLTLIPVTNKPCSRCKEIKPLSNFYTKGDSSKYSSHCRPCVVKSKQANYQKNKHKIQAVYKRCVDRKHSFGPQSDFYAAEKIRYFRHKSKKLGLPFNLEKSDIIVPEYCPVLGIKLEYNPKQPRWNSASVDRIIPSKGYVKGNIIVVSNLANTIKNMATIEQLKAVSDFYCRLEIK